MSVLALWSPFDLFLGIVGPLGAAAAGGTTLLVDLDQKGPRYGGAYSLSDLVARGPTRRELEPTQSGPAVLRNGGVTPEAAEEVVAALVERWPNVVLRCAPELQPGPGRVALLPLLPQPFTPTVPGRAIYQQTHLSRPTRREGHVLPVPRSGTIRALLAGARPRPGDRWIKSFAEVWEN